MTNWEKYFGTPELAGATLRDMAEIYQESDREKAGVPPYRFVLQETCNYDAYTGDDVPRTHELIEWLQGEAS